MLRKQGIIPFMNLQLLAADAGASTGGGTGDVTDTGNQGEDTGANDNQSFDDVLKGNKDYQSEFDRRIAKALNTAQAKWEANQQDKINEALTEAEKLRNMKAEEKAKYEENKRIKALEAREKEITTRELKAQAYETLAEKNLPKELISTLNFESADTCNASIEAVEKAFQSAVEKAINDRLKGNDPKKPTNQTDGSTFGFNFTGVRPKENK